MKRLLLLFLLLVALSACANISPPAPNNTSTAIAIDTEIARAVEETSTQIAEDSAASTKAVEDVPSSTPSEVPPSQTATASATTTATAGEASETPTNTVTPTAMAFDPNDEYGGPTLLDTFANDSNWVDSSNKLPDTDFIKLELGSEQLLVTGKPISFDTWWLTWPSAGDQYLEMKVEVEDCEGRQAYGFLLRAPSANTEAHGYILTFSCDGFYRLRRLDGTSPYSFEDLIAWKADEAINSGDDQINVLGVSLIGDEITIYANGEEIDQVEDNTFSSGRFGLFVNAGPAGNFTFIINQLSFWDLD